MAVILQKHEEDLLLMNSDNTCANGTFCKCITDMGLDSSGTAMTAYGIPLCLLCSRSEGQQHITMEDGYPPSWVTTNNTIIYDKGHYKVSGDNVITQDISGVGTSTLLSTIYHTKTSYVDKTSWELTVCTTPRCKNPIHAYIDIKSAIGISNCNFDVGNNVLLCKFCMKELSKVASDDVGEVHYKGVTYTICRICDSIVIKKPSVLIQMCSGCSDQCKNEIHKSRQICLYCKKTINSSQLKHTQKIKMQKTPTSVVEQVYFCKRHKLYHCNIDDVYTPVQLQAAMMQAYI